MSDSTKNVAGERKGSGSGSSGISARRGILHPPEESGRRASLIMSDGVCIFLILISLIIAHEFLKKIFSSENDMYLKRIKMLTLHDN